VSPDLNQLSNSEFRARWKQWLTANLDPTWPSAYANDDAYMAYQREWDRKLYAGGWAGPSWPAEYGGLGLSIEKLAIWQEEAALAGAPWGLALIGLDVLGPVLMHFGTEDQKKRYLPRMLSAEDVWCQGFSEPEAGSDLASLRTRAVSDDGGGYRIDGTKIWTSFAAHADLMFVLCRTGKTASKREEISFMLLEMKQPGVVVRPIRQITGHADFCEVTLDSAVVRRDDIVGAEGQGWEITRYALSNERGGASAFLRIATAERIIERIRHLQDKRPGQRAALAESALAVARARLAASSLVAREMAGDDLGNEGSLVQVYWSRAWQRVARTAAIRTGVGLYQSPDSSASDDSIVNMLMDSRKGTVAGGATEIQLDIIANRVLNLPRGAAR
jgi:alkylation response protein AidB-like acyl-CoA dehydrogenase